VTIVGDLSSGKRQNVPEGAHLYEADIRSGCAEIFEDFGPEALCHRTAHTDVRRSVREPDFDADVNVLGTIRLLQACIEYGVGKVVSLPPPVGPSTESKGSPRPQRSTRRPRRGRLAPHVGCSVGYALAL